LRSCDRLLDGPGLINARKELIDGLIISQEGSRDSETPSGGEEGGNDSEA
jgi:hypothetical protein